MVCTLLVKLNLQPDAKGSYVEVLERYVNLGPVVDFCVVDLERQGQGQVATCSGAYKDGSLHIVRNGIGINEQASVELQGIKGMWSLRSSTDDPFDTLLVVSFISETRILVMNIEDELEEIEIEGFCSQVQTLFCHDAVFNQLVQVGICYSMEAEKGVSLEDESCVIEKKHVEESVEHLNKEGENVSDSAVPTMNGISEPIKKAEGLNSSGVVVKASAAVSTSDLLLIIFGLSVVCDQETRTLNTGSPKNNKLAKDHKANLKATSPFSHNQRLLTQSLSFPSRGVGSDVLNKSIEVYPVKKEVKHAQRNGTRSQASGGPATSTSRLTHPNRPASIGLHSKEANTIGGTSGRQTSLASMPSIRCSVPGKSRTVSATATCPPTEAPLSVDQNLTPVKAALPVKEDDDVNSTTSYDP
ncbi:dna damage-binding protein 1 [Quercus suber]|uniref:Dna damage-binding protein 1 n=1 Tax=Quercus suber TaxID=58331 RepID=A0AAW0IPM9_QUESU